MKDVVGEEGLVKDVVGEAGLMKEVRAEELLAAGAGCELALVGMGPGGAETMRGLARRLAPVRPLVWMGVRTLEWTTARHEEALRLATSALVTLITEDGSSPPEAAAELVAAAKQAGGAALRVSPCEGPGALADGRLWLCPGARMFDVAEALLRVFGPGLVGLSYEAVTARLGHGGPVVVAVSRAPLREVGGELVRVVGPEVLADALGAFVNFDVAGDDTLADLTDAATLVQDALPEDLPLEFGASGLDAPPASGVVATLFLAPGPAWLRRRLPAGTVISRDPA